MAMYRVLNPDQEVIETREFDNAQDAYDWFAGIEVPSHVLGYRMEVDQDGEWVMFDQTDASGASG